MTVRPIDEQFETAWEIAREGLALLAKRGEEAEFTLSAHWFEPPLYPIDILRRLPDDLVGEEWTGGLGVVLRWKEG